MIVRIGKEARGRCNRDRRRRRMKRKRRRKMGHHQPT